MVVVRLARDKPEALGRIPAFASYLDPDAGHLERFSYRSTLTPAPAPAVFDLRYVGWRQSTTYAPRRPFRASVRFSIRNGCLAIEKPVALPGERRSPAPEDCPKPEGSP
jgi:hypothetical protein